MQGLFTVYLCGGSKHCFTNFNWDILFYNSVHNAKTPAMKVRNSSNGITSRHESNSIKGTVAQDGFFDKKYLEVF
jgi:hypothetical protein